MGTINWERDGLGTVGCARMPNPKRFITVSAAESIAKKLMHEVVTVSATFERDDVVVFSRLVGIAVFGERNAEYYGLYASSGLARVNYCLRRCTWKRVFRSTDEVVKALSAQVLFFDVESLDSSCKEIILMADNGIKDEFQIAPVPSANYSYLRTNISYFVIDDQKELYGDYVTESSTNVAVEVLFQKLKKVFDCLAFQGAIDPLPDSLRISYSFFLMAEAVGVADSPDF